MGNRAANASIKGFEYQLLQSLSMILKSYVKDRTNVIEIEGIEDLDIHGSDSVDLYQFKYYEKSNPRNSVFQEAIAYLFCHWKKHKSESYVYKLLVYSTGELSSMNIKKLMKVLSLKKSSAIREKELTKSDLDIKELNEFLSVFKFEKVCSYEDSLKEIHTQIENIFNVPDEAVSLFYLPLMLKEVHDKAIKESSKSRTVNTNKFIRNIKLKARDMNRIILWNYEDTGKTIQTLHSFLNNEYSLKTQRYSYVLQFGKTWVDDDIISLIRSLVPLFVSKGVRRDNFPLTFGVEKDSNKMVDLKKKLMSKTKKNVTNCVMNDGYETFQFSPTIFSKMPLYSMGKSRVNYSSNFSFNYRLSSLSNCNTALSNFKNPFVFCFDTQYTKHDDTPHLQLNGFEIESIRMLIGRLVKK